MKKQQILVKVYGLTSPALNRRLVAIEANTLPRDHYFGFGILEINIHEYVLKKIAIDKCYVFSKRDIYNDSR